VAQYTGKGIGEGRPFSDTAPLPDRADLAKVDSGVWTERYGQLTVKPMQRVQSPLVVCYLLHAVGLQGLHITP
jgi:hypothetical protein